MRRTKWIKQTRMKQNRIKMKALPYYSTRDSVLFFHLTNIFYDFFSYFVIYILSITLFRTILLLRFCDDLISGLLR